MIRAGNDTLGKNYYVIIKNMFLETMVLPKGAIEYADISKSSLYASRLHSEIVKWGKVNRMNTRGFTYELSIRRR